jgi:hypothetical protein
MKLARSTYYYRSCRNAAEKKALLDRIEVLCTEFPRDGYRRITCGDHRHRFNISSPDATCREGSSGVDRAL